MGESISKEWYEEMDRTEDGDRTVLHPTIYKPLCCGHFFDSLYKFIDQEKIPKEKEMIVFYETRDIGNHITGLQIFNYQDCECCSKDDRYLRYLSDLDFTHTHNDFFNVVKVLICPTLEHTPLNMLVDN